MKLTKKIICSVAAVIGLVTGGVTVSNVTEPVGAVVIDQQAVGDLRVSPIALEIIGNAEGCRRTPYQCPAGLITNGIGNTHGVPDKSVSLETIAKDWVRNIQDSERCVTKAEAQSGKAMTQGQFDAFTSFAFNVGCTRFKNNANGSSTQIHRLIGQGEYARACEELKRWVYGGGKKLTGLVTRRGLEYGRCITLD